jgi:hypothetical protein
MKAALHFHAWLLRAVCLLLAASVNLAAVADDASPFPAASPANQTRSTGESERAFRVELPDGVTIELVGVCESPIRSDGWWRPDGVPMPKAPEGEAKDYVGYEPNSIARAFALDVVTDGTANVLGPGPGPDEDWYSQSSGASIKRQAAGKVLEKRQIVAKLPPKARTTVAVAYAGGPWKTVATASKRGTGAAGVRPKGGVVWDYASDEHGAARIAAAYNVGDDIPRIVAIDEQNQEHMSQPRGDASANGVHLLSARFPGLPLARVREFCFQTRTFNHHVEFRNVSLHRGQKSPVQIFLDGRRYAPTPGSLPDDTDAGTKRPPGVNKVP